MKISPPSIPDEMKNVDSELVYVEEDDALKLSAPTGEDEMKNEEDDALKLSAPTGEDEMKNEEDDALKFSAPTGEAEINSVDSEIVALEGDDALKLSAPSLQDEFNSVDSEIVSVEDNDALNLSAPSVPVADTEVAAVDDEYDMPEEATMEQAIAAYEEEQLNIALANPVNPFIRPNPRNRADWVEGDYIDFANWVNFEKFYRYVRADDLEIVTTWVINNPGQLNTHLWF